MAYEHTWADVERWIEKSSKLFIKKLSRNDCSWADDRENGHQNGFYIPREIREAKFFPKLKNSNPEKPHIFDARFETFWPSTGETKASALKWYSNKGPETHCTRVPKDEFEGLTPASLLVCGHLKKAEGAAHYWVMVIDSASEEAELLESVFELGSDFHSGIFDPAQALRSPKDDVEVLIEELNEALRKGSLATFISSVARMPDPGTLAASARQVYLDETGLTKFDPFEIAAPGDAIMRISRDIEYSLYKRAQLRHRAAEAVRIIADGGADLATSVVRGFQKLDALFLSASQQRKSRAGQSFEKHVGAALRGGRIRFEEQAVTDGRRPDFVMPDVATLRSERRAFEAALVLSLKTTLRERWKQVNMEKFNSALFLATVDDRVSENAINDMNDHGICLVVPESLKQSRETCYAKKSNVITFRNFFDEEISCKRPALKMLAAP